MQVIAQLYTDDYRDIHRFLLKISGYEQEIAEDLTQETFYQAYKSLASFQGRCHIKTWLIQIAKNTYYQHLKKITREQKLLRNLRHDKNFSVTAGLESDLANTELIRHALTIINACDDRTRDVMLYRLYSDLPYSQISLLLGISEGSAKVVFFRGKSVLQAKLREDYHYEI